MPGMLGQRPASTINIQAGPHTITAADPVPDDLREAPSQDQHCPLTCTLA
jgi:hypothetical protein